MQPLWRIGTRNWRTRPGRAALSVAAVMLGVGVVVWVTCCYESVRRSVTRVVLEWIGSAHVIVEPVEGVWAVFSQDLEADIAALPGVSHTTVRTREYVDAAALRMGDDLPSEGAPPNGKPGGGSVHRPPSTIRSSQLSDWARIEVTGVVPEKEPMVRTYLLSRGRFIQPGDDGAIVVEKLLADGLELGIGDRIRLRSIRDVGHSRDFRIVGVVDRRRASANQAPMTWATLSDVQTLVGLPGMIKGIDVVLAEPTVENIRATAERIGPLVRTYNESADRGPHEAQSLQVKTTETQHATLGAAQGLLQFIMLLLACVVLLTAFFIIFASMSMGVGERVTELGLLRCVGVTRRQVARLVLLQTLPLGLTGTLLGIPLGLALQWATIEAARDYLGSFVVSGWGVALAAAGGLGTTLFGAALPAIGAMKVSPVEAARPHAGGRLTRWIWFMTFVGVAALVAHEWVQRSIAPSDDDRSLNAVAIVSLLLLYGGTALVAPLVMVSVGRIAAVAAAAVLRLRPQLLREEIDRSPDRSAAIASGLAVGLSLIVGLVVWGQSVRQGWRFPSEFPDAMLYSYDALPLESVRALADTPGITDFTVADDFAFSFSRPSRLGLFRTLSMLDQSSRFLAIDPDAGFRAVKLTFLEGSERDALRKLKEGGHVLVTREFAKARDLHLGDAFDIWVGQTRASFRIAGVIGSPGIDIAISFFNASEFFQFYAVGAIVGTLDDARRLFGRGYGKMMLFNFDVRAAEPPPDAPDAGAAMELPKPAAPGERQTFSLGPGPVPGGGPEERIVNVMLERLGWPSKAFVTARELKRQIDDNLNRVTLLLSVIPAVGLLIAALGLANLMAAGVAARGRQIALLRAIGLTRGQMTRIIVGEAVVLGLIGSALGLCLGLMLARTSIRMTTALSGFEPVYSVRWGLVMAGAALATLLCLAAALLPARRAGRTNIVAALAGA